MKSPSNTTVAAVSVFLVSSIWLSISAYKDHRRRERSKWVDQEKEDEGETLPSIIEHFRNFKLDYGSSVSEANKRRTTKYYEMARDAHKYDLCPGVRSYPRLRNKREAELRRIYRYHDRGDQSHRTIIIMCDSHTSEMLCQARDEILGPLDYSTDETTDGCWIPAANLLPPQHLHVSVATPWWWHTIRPGNRELSEELVARFRQALVLEFHHAFQIELERIVLLGGKTLVALWRCVGERKNPDDFVIYDRHGEGHDPFVKLRRDIVRCFTTGASDFGKEPLTYSHRHGTYALTPEKKKTNGEKVVVFEQMPKIPPRQSNMDDDRSQNTIECKSPGLGDHDGFIHTTLARLPIDCLSMTDVELAPIHRLCREATATYCGHRMVVSNFRFVETTGAGGESNPCVDPILDEYVEAPARFAVGVDGNILETNDLHSAKIVERNATIGNIPQLVTRPSLDGLFNHPAAQKAASTEPLN